MYTTIKMHEKRKREEKESGVSEAPGIAKPRGVEKGQVRRWEEG